MIDTVRWRILLVALAGWVNRHQLEAIEYLREENRVLKEHLGGRRLHLTDGQRRRLASRGHPLGRSVLTHVATLVTPDTILRWHRQLIARKWTTARRRVGRPGVMREIRLLAMRMARENPTWGYRRIQGALKNLGHRVARSTIASILRAHGIGPVPERPMSWRTFLAAHWGVIAAADFFTTEVWTVRGLVTYYTVFVMELASRRVHLLGSTPSPDEAFVLQVARTLTRAGDGVLIGHRILICDRDTKWSGAFRQTLADAGIRVVRTPYRAPNCNAHAERFVRTIKAECLDRVVLLGEAHLRRTLAAFAVHYHRERNHQGIQDQLTLPSRQGHRTVQSAAAPGSADSSATITERPEARPSFRIVRASNQSFGNSPIRQL
jgi:transposase InsO family protein